jgi:hypothetical protein
MKRASLTFAFAATIFAAAEASAEPNKEQYDLQERCGKRAEQMFKSDNPGQAGGSVITNTEDGQNITNYQNHYSATFNKCFYLLITTSVNFKQKPAYTMTLTTLFDINDNREYGSFFKRSDNNIPVQCNIQQKVCHSEGEWRDMLTPYVDE